MEERTTGPAFTRQEQRVNQLAAQYVELVNSGQDGCQPLEKLL